MNELSRLIKAISSLNKPPPGYFKSFLPSFKKYQKKINKNKK